MLYIRAYKYLKKKWSRLLMAPVTLAFVLFNVFHGALWAVISKAPTSLRLFRKICIYIEDESWIYLDILYICFATIKSDFNFIWRVLFPCCLPWSLDSTRVTVTFEKPFWYHRLTRNMYFEDGVSTKIHVKLPSKWTTKYLIQTFVMKNLFTYAVYFM